MNTLEAIPADQQRIRDMCFHPTGTFVEFTKDETDQSIPARFEKQVASHPHRLAAKADAIEGSYRLSVHFRNRIMNVAWQTSTAMA